jgi:hypothetical protein
MRIIAIVILAAALPAWGTFKCVDEKGKTHIGDSPPAACANVVTYEVSASGVVVRKIEPSGAAKAAADGKTRDSDKAAVDAKRRDRMLLDSFGSERDFDVARERNTEMIRGRIEATDLRLKQLEKREKDLALLGARAPSADVEAVKTEKATLSAAQERYNKDLEQTKAQYEADKKRWLELRAGK